MNQEGGNMNQVAKKEKSDIALAGMFEEDRISEACTMSKIKPK